MKYLFVLLFLAGCDTAIPGAALGPAQKACEPHGGLAIITNYYEAVNPPMVKVKCNNGAILIVPFQK